MDSIAVDALSRTINCPVLKMPERRYPGILIQGDTLKSLLGIAEQISKAQLSGDIEELRESVSWLLERLRDYVDEYESVLQRHNIQLPYVKSVS